MKMLSKFIAWFRNVLIGLFIFIFLFLTTCYAFRKVEQYKTTQLFLKNRMIFEEIAGGKGRKDYVVNIEEHFVVPFDLQETGISDIYFWKENCFFEHRDRVLSQFPQGIAYVYQLEHIPEWIILSEISDRWYYYRIVS